MNANSSSVTIRFSQGEGPVTQYRIAVKKESDPITEWLVRHVISYDGQKTHLIVTVDNLEHNTEYVIKVEPVYDDGTDRVEGRSSPEISVNTDCKGTSFIFYYPWYILICSNIICLN